MSLITVSCSACGGRRFQLKYPGINHDPDDEPARYGALCDETCEDEDDGGASTARAFLDLVEAPRPSPGLCSTSDAP